LDSLTVWTALAAINQKVEEVRAGANKDINSTPAAYPLLATKVTKLEQDLLATVIHLSQAISVLSVKLDAKELGPIGMDTSEMLGAGFYADLQERMGKITSQIENLE
jgi:hypothetical protein